MNDTLIAKKTKENEAKNEKTPSIIELFVESLEKVCSESTSHGIPNIFRTKNWIIRVLWFVLFLIGSGFASYCKTT